MDALAPKMKGGPVRFAEVKTNYPTIPFTRTNSAMNEYQVTCTTKAPSGWAHEHITHIGGTGGGGWRITKEDAIDRIENRGESFFTIDYPTGRKVHVSVVRGDGSKAPYLRTHADGKWNDNLLALPAC